MNMIKVKLFSNKILMYQIGLFFFAFVFFVSAQSIQEIGQIAKEQRQKVIDTPIKISYDCEIIQYFHDYPILKILPDNKVEVVMSDSQIQTDKNNKPSTLIAEYSEKYKLPFTTTKKKVTIIKTKKCVRLEEQIIGDELNIIEVYDGKDTKLYKHCILTSVDGKKKIDSKIGHLFKGSEKYTIYRFYPFDLWPSGEFKPTDKVEKTDDGLFKFTLDSNSRTYEFSLSPQDDYMKRSHHIIGYKYSEDLMVHKTTTVGNLILPADVEVNQYKGEKLLPERLIHYTNFNYQIITEEEGSSLCRFEFPKGTKIGEISTIP
jgi:hypothetical protein